VAEPFREQNLEHAESIYALVTERVCVKRSTDLPRTLALASVMAYKHGREGYMMKIVATARKTGT
jgi:hypothetical protein